MESNQPTRHLLMYVYVIIDILILIVHKKKVLIEDLDLFFSKNASEPQDNELFPILSQFLKQHHIMVISTTRRPDQLPLEVRSWFDDEIHLQIPTPIERLCIMQHIYDSCFHIRTTLNQDDLYQLSFMAHGFVPADIMHWFQLAEESALLEGNAYGTGHRTHNMTFVNSFLKK